MPSTPGESEIRLLQDGSSKLLATRPAISGW
jgi:hypothetical protein